LLEHLACRYALYNDTTRVYTLEFRGLQGQLTYSAQGGYAASFAGIYDGRAPVLTEVQVLKGQFQQVRNVRDLRK
jgi:hypothetical protein